MKICSRPLLLTLGSLVLTLAQADAQRLEILFLGDDGHHVPAQRYPQIIQALGSRGINFTYAGDASALNPDTLNNYDGLLIYANTDVIQPDQEKALLDYVRSGHGFIPAHCASFCFRNSQAYVRLVGAQFQRHETGVFSTTIANPNHPIMKGFTGFETWDETYVHTMGAPDRDILQKREDEPWTWTRNEGQGRVFYTAYGHDERTWSNPGFHELMYRGILWSVGDKRAAEFEKWKPAPFTYTKADVPNYERRDPPPQLQGPLSPDESQKHIQVPVDTTLTRVAEEPLIYNVIDMKFDERGRLWVVETKDYPNELKAPGSGRDRISILEDTNGDGVMDKQTTFADKISIPTSFCFVNDGIVVTAAPDMLYLKDTDGDGVADERKILFSGWGTGDTHAGPSNLHYGFDGWVYGTVGYSGFNGVVGGKQFRFGQAVWRIKPDGTTMEVLGMTTNNTWGLGMSENGDIFGSTANNQSSFYLPIRKTYADDIDGVDAEDRLPGIDANKRMWVIMDKLRQVDVMGGYTAAAGHELYTARSFPQECWNRMALITEPTGHVVYRTFLDQKGTSFSATNGWNLFAGADEWIAPVVATTGPDGAVWVSDWYSFLVQHNPTPSPRNGGFQAKTGRGNAFESDLRDTERCRLYKITPKGGQPSATFSLTKNDPAGLLAALKSDNLLWRLHGQRLLTERGNTDVVPELLKLVADTSTDAVGINGGAIQAVWTLGGLGAVQPGSDVLAAVTAALKHPSQGVRRAALWNLPRSAESVSTLLAAGALTDKEPLVRLTAMQVLCEMPASRDAGKALYAVGNDNAVKNDRWLPTARAIAAVRHGAGFLEAALAAAPATPAAEVAPAPPAENLLPNPSIEKLTGTSPDNWAVRTYNGQAEHAVATLGHTGGHSLFIESERGSDTSWHIDVPLEPGSDYLLTGWIKTENLKAIRGGKGAMLELHQLNGKQPMTKPLTGTNDWTQVELRFASGGQRELSINCLYGGWGQATGKAWFDDLSLTLLGKSSGGENGEAVDAVGIVAKNLTKFNPPADVSAVMATLASANNATAAEIRKAMGNAGAVVAEETEEELAKTHQIVHIKSTVGTLQYDQMAITVAAGKPVAIIYDNPDQLQHNLVICKPGSYEAVGAATDKMITDPDGFAKSFIPDSVDILAKTKLLDPGQKAIIKFNPPAPGEYPYLCTFPAHWRIMHGVLTVK